MDRERLGRLLSASLVPLGVAMLALSAVTDEPVGAALGGAAMVLGAAIYWAGRRFSDVEFDLTKTPSLAMNLVQLGAVLVTFALLTYLVGDPSSVAQSINSGVPSPTYPAYAGLVMGVFLGGGVAYLMQRLDDVGKVLAESIPARMVGFSLTFGTYVLLLVYQPPSSVLYAGAYLFSRIGVLVGAVTLSRR